MNVNEEMKELAGRAFISYVKKCLKHARRDYYQKQNPDLYRLTFLSDLTFEAGILDVPSHLFPSEDYILLLQASSKLKLSPKEKKILFMKFFEDKSDREIAQALGITRQAVSKSKSQLLIKLRKYMAE